jgi:hypothetical protein
MFGRATPVLAAEEDRGVPAERLERLEQRVNEMAQRQEQLLQRLGTQQERQASTAAVGAEDMRRRMALRERAGLGQVMPPSRAASLAPASTPAGPPEHDVNLRKKIADMLGLCFLIGVIFNILVAIWIFTDIRKRGEGPGIFVALALLAGIPTAIIYALLRIGDKKA